MQCVYWTETGEPTPKNKVVNGDFGDWFCRKLEMLNQIPESL